VRQCGGDSVWVRLSAVGLECGWSAGGVSGVHVHSLLEAVLTEWPGVSGLVGFVFVEPDATECAAILVHEMKDTLICCGAVMTDGGVRVSDGGVCVTENDTTSNAWAARRKVTSGESVDFELVVVLAGLTGGHCIC